MKRTPSHPPSGLPVLGGGSHADPADGACFMEYASLLARERWSDHPRCTHPALAQLARLVNDHICDDVRQGLVPLVPEALGLAGRTGTVTPMLVLLCLDRLASLDMERDPFRRQRRRAERRLSRAARGGIADSASRLSDAVYRNGSGARIMLAVVRTLSRNAPEELPGLLADAIDATRNALGAQGTNARPGAGRRGSQAAAF